MRPLSADLKIAVVGSFAVALLSACSGMVSDGGDSGPPRDAGLQDAGSQTDAGWLPDAGSAADAGSQGDGGSSVDAGASGDGGSAAVDGGCPPPAIFCERFEQGLDPGRWATNGDPTTFSIDTSTATPDGRSSLHMAFGAPYGHTGHQTVELKTPIPAPDDRLYLRTYVRFGNLALPGQHPFFIDVADSRGAEVGFGSIINDFATMAWAPGGLDNARIWYEGGGSSWHPGVEDGDQTPASENGLTAQTWICLELMFFGDHQSAGDTQHDAEQITVWINGNEVPQLGATDALWRLELGRDPPEHWSPLYDHARWRFGVESFGPRNVALDLWFDALVISPSRIGCAL